MAGATGAIGSALVAALQGDECEVVPVSRHPLPGAGLAVDFGRVPPREWWAQQLRGIDVVVNAAGIIRETAQSSFDAVHMRAPIELFLGCVQAGVRHVVQVSALGADEQAATPFHRSKKAADDALRSMPVASTIVQPSLVYGRGVASAALFDRLAAFPWVALPRGGDSVVQPVALDDVVRGLVALVKGPAGGSRTVAFVGPTPMTLRQYLELLRTRQGLPPRQRVLRLPDGLSLAAARLLQALPASPLTRDAVAMLLRGNAAPAEAFGRLLGRPPRSFALPPSGPAGEARRQTVLLSLWLGPLRGVVALMWVWTGLVSLGLFPQARSLDLLASVGVAGVLAWWALYAAAVLDLALGVAVFATRGARRRRVWLGQLAPWPPTPRS